MFRSLVSCYFHRDFVCCCCLSFSTNFFLSRALCVCTCTCCNLCNLFSCTLITLNLTKRIERQFSHGVDEKKAPSCVYCMCMQTFSTQHTYLSFSSFNEFFFLLSRLRASYRPHSVKHYDYRSSIYISTTFNTQLMCTRTTQRMAFAFDSRWPHLSIVLGIFLFFIADAKWENNSAKWHSKMRIKDFCLLLNEYMLFQHVVHHQKQIERRRGRKTCKKSQW